MSSQPGPGVEPAEQVRRLVEGGRVAEARRYLETAPHDGALLDWWRSVLAPPKIELLPTSSGSAERMALNTRWLNAHADEHRGEWVALRGDQFLDADRDTDVLELRLPEDPTITLIWIPPA